MFPAKPIVFRGTALTDLGAFPETVRRESGYQLDRVQNGLDPNDWKPMPTIGPGVREIRVRDDSGAFRVIYVASFAHAIFVLHCFQKKTEKTSARDVQLATRRFRELVEEMKR